MPVLAKQASPSRRRVGWNVEHTARRQAMPHVAGGPFLRRQVAVDRPHPVFEPRALGL